MRLAHAAPLVRCLREFRPRHCCDALRLAPNRPSDYRSERTGSPRFPRESRAAALSHGETLPSLASCARRSAGACDHDSRPSAPHDARGAPPATTRQSNASIAGCARTNFRSLRSSRDRSSIRRRPREEPNDKELLPRTATSGSARSPRPFPDSPFRLDHESCPLSSRSFLPAGIAPPSSSSRRETVPFRALLILAFVNRRA